MGLRRSEALVLKPTAYREKDFVVNFLTRDFGKKTGILYGARSIRSPYRGLAEPFVLLRLHFFEKEQAEMVTVRGADLLDSHPALRKNYDDFLHASYFTELIIRCVIPDHESGAYYELLAGALGELPAEQVNSVRKMDFELQLIQLLGVFPELDRCVLCADPIWLRESGRPVLYRNGVHLMDIRQGGLRCWNCTSGYQEVLQLQPGSLIYLIHWRESLVHGTPGSTRPTHQNLLEFDKMTRAFFQQHFHWIPKSHALLRNRI